MVGVVIFHGKGRCVLEFTITAIKRGIDWIAWAVPNEEGEIEFSKEALQGQSDNNIYKRLFSADSQNVFTMVNGLVCFDKYNS